MTESEIGQSSSGGRQSVFRRDEVALAHAIYGLILTLATVGELIHHEESAAISVAWLLGAGAVLLGAHVFSSVTAHMAAIREDPNWSEIMSVSREEVMVVAGAVGAALIMTVAAIADLDSEGALLTCLVVGLVSVGALTYYATVHHSWVTRLAMSAVGVGLGILIVTLENVF